MQRPRVVADDHLSCLQSTTTTSPTTDKLEGILGGEAHLDVVDAGEFAILLILHYSSPLD